MNIKSLLIGSAAALVSVSGARAADAIMAEPEPVEYVRVCDAYGAGFYYIPGTETCLRIGGYVQYDIGIGEVLGYTDVEDKEDGDDDNDTYFARTRVQLNFDARSDTEYGTLRAYAALRFNYATIVNDDNRTDTDTAFSVNQGYIELGGLRIGRTDSLFTTFTGYAGNVINDTFGDLGYGPFDTNQIAYTFKSDSGFTAAVAVEEGDGDDFTIDSYAPHFVAGLGYTASWGGITGVFGYDSVYEEYAGKIRVDFNATEQLSFFVMGGYQSEEDSLNYYGQWDGDYVIFAGGSFQFSEKASFNAQVIYNEEEDFAVVANVAYELVPGLTITPEVAYVSYSDDDSTTFIDEEDDSFNGWLRFRRSF